jgi:quinol monooxygenase YgiN
VFNQQEANMQTQTYTSGYAVVAMWEARDGEIDAITRILARFVPQAQKEPGVQLFLVHQAADDPSQFLFYELFDDAAAFTAHQETEHFKALIQGEALPRLKKRERRQYDLI